MRNRFFGKYRGVVVDVDASTMRVKASVPAVLGGVSSGWCAPCVPYAGPQVGFFMLPDIGSGVWIEFEGGDVSFPIWTGCYWSSGDIPSAAATDTQNHHHRGRQPGVRQQRRQRHAAGLRRSTAW